MIMTRSLRILCIGRGEQTVDATPHRLKFVANAYADSECRDIVSPSEFDFVFLHLNNQEAEQALAAWREAGLNQRVIGFAGGDETPEIKNLTATFEIPFMSGLADQSALISLPWAQVTNESCKSARFLAQRLSSRPALLMALSILCQGYLGAHGGEALGDEWKDVPDDLRATALGQATRAERARWWRDVFKGAHGENLLTEQRVSAEWGEMRNLSYDAVAELIGQINSKGKDEKVEPRSVEKAYHALHRRLEGVDG